MRSIEKLGTVIKNAPEMKTRNAIILIVCCLATCTLRMSAQAPAFAPPGNEEELERVLKLLEQWYAPFLRSLPEKVEFRTKTMLPEEWDFCYEYQDIDGLARLPYEYVNYAYDPEHGSLYAKAWDRERNRERYLHGEELQWERVTIPEWRYEYRKHRPDGSEWEEDMNPEKMPWNFRSAANVVAWYRTNFRAPANEEGKRVFLCFDGVDWAAEVYLNGTLLGDHEVYCEPFRFDVTSLLEEENQVAVRVIDGPAFGQPYAPWSIFPDIRAEEHLYVPDKERSIKGVRPIGHHSGGGFGIFRHVYLEVSGHTRIDGLFVRNDLQSEDTRIKVELDAADQTSVELQMEIMPENFEGGRNYKLEKTLSIEKGQNVLSFHLPMKGAKAWHSDSPAMYRCRVRVLENGKMIDGKDVLFGCRSFEAIGSGPGRDGLKEGQLMLNGDPVFLRGTNIQGLNVFSYWGQEDKLLRSVLMLKAAGFNIIRSTQHVQFPEVREMLDRLGMMSEQDQAAGSQSDIADYRQERRNLLLSGKVLPRVCYNNPGVVLLSFGNECYYDPNEIIEEVLKVDPQRVIKPISGRNMHNPRPMEEEYPLGPELTKHVVDDYHDYKGWYDQGRAPFWKCPVIHELDHLLTVGEFGGEGLDGYETMAGSYPDHIKPPARDTDVLWAASQVEKRDVRQIVGFYGREPSNLGEYIEASQTYQAELVATQMAGFRIASDHIGGYFQFHFLDAVPCFWPKSIVSFDLKPKKAFFGAAQVNQPVVPLFRLRGDQKRARSCEIWVSNVTNKAIEDGSVSWRIVSRSGEEFLSGKKNLNIKGTGSTFVEQFEFPPGFSGKVRLKFELELKDGNGRLISGYNRTVPVLQWPDGPYAD